jgi:multidrug efflux system membrane fusion protein
VRRQDIDVKVAALGNITAANVAVVKAKIEGELKSIHFKEGQFVQAGALLAQIDPRAWQIALAQAEGQHARDRALLQNAQLDLARFKDLLSKDGIARQQVDTQEALVRQLQGTVQSDQAQVDNARLQLSYTRITAPISGRVGLKQADLGNVVKPGDPLGLLTIAQTRPANVVFAVPDVHLPQIQSQLKAGRPLTVEAWDREQKRRLAVGQVASLDNAIDAATGTVKLKAEFKNEDDGLFPNQFVNVRLSLATVSNTLAVPSAALMRDARGDFVYRINDDKTVNARKVQAGPSDGDWVAVRPLNEGELAAGDRVVIDGVDRLRDGATVEVIRPGGADGSPGAAREARRGGPPVGTASGADTTAAVAPPRAAESASTAGRVAERSVADRPAERGAAARPVGNPTDRAPSRAATVGEAATLAQTPPTPSPGERPDFLSRLPPEVAERVRAMSPEERRAFFEQRRAERAAREAATDSAATAR